MTNQNVIGDLKSLFNNANKIKVPSYQRAYSWGEEQLNHFVSDMLEIKNDGNYYYGHFIMEETNEGYEIIDGQQRLTTLILFLMVCRLFKKEGYEDYINKFETVDYDNNSLKIIESKIKDTTREWRLEDFELERKETLSIRRIVFALNHFRNLFHDRKPNLKLEPSEIDNYVKTFTLAHISTHITDSKAVAVQIFELQNTRGLKLNLIEKVKSKLMKAVYLNAKSEKKEEITRDIQKRFAEIYRLEETVNVQAFRGSLTLVEILFHHLRLVDDGTKIFLNDKHQFNSPGKAGNKEEIILSYLDEQFNRNEDIINYIKNLAERFQTTVELVSEFLSNKDEENPLIGDVLILDKNLSLEFFILLYHKGLYACIESKEILRLWENLLFIRDFHGKYYHQVYRDDFERLYNDIALIEEATELKSILSRYIKDGFRKELMDENLPNTVSKYIETNKNNILNNAFYWWQEKMVYLLYKYEIQQKADMLKLRKIMKDGRSIEHMLPQEWDYKWICESDANSIFSNEKNAREEIGKVINGIGNLLLITGSENSSKSNNNHPMSWHYVSCSGGSYDMHNDNKSKWTDYRDWNEIIINRGNKIFNFLKEFIS